MSGKRKFDYERAVERATRLFWRKGYSNTSLRDLLRVMEIGESSFYNTIRSKKHLYLICLRHYNETVTMRRWKLLAAEPSVKRGLRRFFAAVLDDLDDPGTPNVCLMAGSLSADVLTARDLKRYVVREMSGLRAALVARLEAGQKSGEIARSVRPEVAAQVIVTYLQGFYRVVRVLNDRKEMERQIEALLEGLGL